MSFWFGHSGDLGDIIYSLPTIRALGGGVLYLFHKPGSGLHGMNAAKAESLRSLLIQQPYIHDVFFTEDQRETDLNNFRAHAAAERNLADMHLAAHGLGREHRDVKWLRVDCPNRMAPVVFARSMRLRNLNFAWKQVHQKYAHAATFVGTAKEHEMFCHEVGPVPHAPTANVLELARVIAGADLFVGNQSLPAAIAEGLKSTMILEVSRDVPDCLFERMGRINGWGGPLALPELEPREEPSDGATVLLTSTIRPFIPVALSDPRERLCDYLCALISWLRTPSVARVIFCDNSGARPPEQPLMRIAEAEGKKLEILSFETPPEVRPLGKGYGEGLIFQHVLEHSRLLTHSFFKMTGRLHVANFDSVYGYHLPWPNVLDPMGDRARDTRCFKAEVPFLRSVLLPAFFQSHEQRPWVEWTVDAALRNRDVPGFGITPIYVGRAGHENLPYTRWFSPEIEREAEAIASQW